MLIGQCLRKESCLILIRRMFWPVPGNDLVRKIHSGDWPQKGYDMDFFKAGEGLQSSGITGNTRHDTPYNLNIRSITEQLVLYSSLAFLSLAAYGRCLWMSYNSTIGWSDFGNPELNNRSQMVSVANLYGRQIGRYRYPTPQLWFRTCRKHKFISRQQDACMILCWNHTVEGHVAIFRQVGTTLDKT